MLNLPLADGWSLNLIRGNRWTGDTRTPIDMHTALGILVLLMTTFNGPVMFPATGFHISNVGGNWIIMQFGCIKVY